MAQRTIDMQYMRYMNLFEKVSHVASNMCFNYNNCIVFAVPSAIVSRAVGKQGMNVRRLSQILGRKIKVIEMPHSPSDLNNFVRDLVAPVEFSNLSIENGIVTIAGERQAKAMLIGRDRVKEKELELILKKFFNIEKLRIA